MSTVLIRNTILYLLHVDQSAFPENGTMDSPETRCEVRSGVYVCAARTGSSVTLICNAMGNPQPEITFTPANAPISGNNIVFPMVSVSNAGNYTCTASSPGFDDIERRFQLMVGGKLCKINVIAAFSRELL